MTPTNNLILHPLTTDTFLSESWERKHCHIQRQTPDYFQHLIGVEGIQHYLSTHSVSHPSVQLVHSTQNLSPAEYTDDQRTVNLVDLDEYIAQGATLVLSQMHLHFSQLAALCRQVSTDLQMRSQANVYLSPPGNQGFQSHYDTHDVFILQVSGRKTFRFYPSDVELPFPDDQYDPDQNPHTNISFEVLLEAGDTLYIPRGLVHDAVAMPDHSSLHITLGVFPLTVRDLLQSCIQVAAEHDVLLRKSLSFGTTTTHQTHQWSAASLREQIAQCLSDEHIKEAYSRALDDMAIESIPLSQLTFNRPSLSGQSIVALAHEAIFGFERLGDTLKLRAHGQTLSFEEPLSSAVECLLVSEPRRLDAIPELSYEQQLALCTHLQHSHLLLVQNS